MKWYSTSKKEEAPSYTYSGNFAAAESGMGVGSNLAKHCVEVLG